MREVSMDRLQQTAQALLAAGVSVLPVHPASDPDRGKRPTLKKWKHLQTTRLPEAEAAKLFSNGANLALIGGAVSGGLECVDFDDPGLFSPFMDTLQGLNQNLYSKLILEQTPSGGYHLVYRCPAAVGGNTVLARTSGGKTAIETRGSGGYFLVAPSAGYKPLRGDLLKLPVISATDRDLLHRLATSFCEAPAKLKIHQATGTTDGQRVGDRYNQEADLPALLERHGWQPTGRIGPGGQHWTRPGKDDRSTAATLKDGCFYVFSSNAAPFEPGQWYDAFGCLVRLEFNGDFGAAAKSLSTASSSTGLASEQPTAGLPSRNGQCVDPAALLGRFKVTDDYVNGLGKEEFLIENLLIRQHILVNVALSGGGKTAFWYRYAAPLLAQKGLSVWYLDADSPASEHKAMKEIADRYGFEFLNVDANLGTGIDQMKKTIEDIANGGCDLANYVLIFDTLKKFTDLMGKEKVKYFFGLCRKMTGRGGTVVLLGHANKYRSKEGYLIPEGVGDVRSDTDELIFFERKKNENTGGLDVTTDVDHDHGAKVRGIFKPFSFHIAVDREVTLYDKVIEMPDYNLANTRGPDDLDILDATVEFLEEYGQPVSQGVLVDQVRAMTGAGRDRVRQVILANSMMEGSEKGKRLLYAKEARGRMSYSLPKAPPEQNRMFEQEAPVF